MHEKRRLNYPVMQQFIDGYDYQLKFVVDRKKDLDEVRAVVDRLQHVDPAKVMLMAQGIKQEELADKARWIVESCKQYGYQLHTALAYPAVRQSARHVIPRTRNHESHIAYSKLQITGMRFNSRRFGVCCAGCCWFGW